MKPTRLVLAAGLSLMAAFGALSGSQAQAATTGQTVISTSIPEYLTISVGASVVPITTSASALQNGVTTGESAPMSVSVGSNVDGDIFVKVRTLDNNNRSTGIKPSDLKIKVEDVGSGPGDSQTLGYGIFKQPPTAPAQPQAMWGNYFTEGVRQVSFTVKFQHSNLNLYQGRTAPYTNRVEFTITK